MAKLIQRKFKPTPEEVVATGIPPMEKEEILASLTAYKLQNPVKYEAKKAALFAKYGFNVQEDSVEVVPDANDIELAEIKENLTKVVKDKKDAK